MSSSLPKGSVEAGAALTNSFLLEIPILGAIKFVSMGSLDQELKTTILADSTAMPTGKVDPVTTEAKQYAHHTAERLALEAWYAMNKSGTLGYKQIGILHMLGADGQAILSWLLDGMICNGRVIPELDSSGEGEGAMLTWKLTIDNVIPL